MENNIKIVHRKKKKACKSMPYKVKIYCVRSKKMFKA